LAEGHILEGNVLNSFSLKILACLAMSVDHYGIMFAPDSIGYRIIGRIAFPIFAFLVAEGASKTHDMQKYLARMFLFALISQAPFAWALPEHGLNIFFTLCAGLLAVSMYESYRSLWLVALIAISSTAAGVEYGGGGTLAIFLMHHFGATGKRSALVVSAACLVLSMDIFMDVDPTAALTYAQPFALLAVPLILAYDGKRGPEFKWGFYVFYPAHLVLLYAAKALGSRIVL
jgi:hypothetical protein